MFVTTKKWLKIWVISDYKAKEPLRLDTVVTEDNRLLTLLSYFNLSIIA